MEACATSHYWARELAKFGHTVKLVPPAYVKPYVKRGKNDATDVEAICEAVTWPNMRFVPVKSADQLWHVNGYCLSIVAASPQLSRAKSIACVPRRQPETASKTPILS
jgi:hypothetical protein